MMPPFQATGADRLGVRLRALRDIPAGPPLRAFLRGIELGRVALGAAVAAGTELTLPITRMPRIEPPMELRFATDRAGPDLAPPWPLATIGEATALVGPGELTLSALRLEAGVLRGYAENAVNGLIEPLLHARINGGGARAVHSDPPQPLAAGGCGFRFALALQPADLQESGLLVSLHAAGQDAPLAHWAWARADPAGLGPAVAALQARAAAQERASASLGERLAAAQDAALARQQERIDAFIAAAATLLFDRIAVPPRMGGAPTAEAATLRALIAAAGAPAQRPVAAMAVPGQAVLDAEAGGFGFGWHPAERDAGGPFRWMGDRGMVLNPEPERPVAAIAIAVAHIYGAATPGVLASLDRTPCRVSVAREGTGFALRIAPEGGAVASRALLLESPHAGVPALAGGGGDRRQLSVAVARIVFEYAA